MCIGLLFLCFYGSMDTIIRSVQIVLGTEALDVEVKNAHLHNRMMFPKPLKNKGKINLKSFKKGVDSGEKRCYTNEAVTEKR